MFGQVEKKKNLSKEKLPGRSQQQNGRDTVKDQNNRGKIDRRNKTTKTASWTRRITAKDLIFVPLEPRKRGEKVKLKMYSKK